MNTDEELYARFLCGEDEALGQLMERYFERLTLFCATFLNSVAEAEEMAAWTAFADRRAQARRVARRELPKLAVPHRAQPLRLPIPNAEVHPVPFDESCPLAASSGTEADFWRREETGALLALLDRLPEAERRVLTMIYLENASYAQTARALGVDEKRVDNLAYRGKRRLREWLRQEEGEHE